MDVAYKLIGKVGTVFYIHADRNHRVMTNEKDWKIKLLIILQDCIIMFELKGLKQNIFWKQKVLFYVTV